MFADFQALKQFRYPHMSFFLFFFYFSRSGATLLLPSINAGNITVRQFGFIKSVVNVNWPP